MNNSKMFDLVDMFKKFRRKFLWKLIYNRVYNENDGFSIQILNYGYANAGSPDGIGSSCRKNYPAHDVYGFQLYLNVMSYGTLDRGMKVLEVGCGTGYGLADQAQKNPEVEFTGLDFSGNAIKRAKSKFSNTKNLIFIEGSSMDLPFKNETFDLIFNVESSHCYSDKGKFFSEVERGLKPGGTFIITDFRMPVNYDKFLINIQKYFQLDKEFDITENVVRSLQKLTPIRHKIFDDYFFKHPIKGFMVRNLLERFAGQEGSRTFNRFTSGYWKYFLCVLKKPD